MRKGASLLAAILLAACSAGGTASESDVRRAADQFASVAAAVDDAWNGKDLEALRSVYSEDVVHDEESSLNHFEGIDAILAMATVVFPSLPGSQSTGPLYVGKNGGVGVAGEDGVLGVARATDAGPREEIDLLHTTDAKVSYWAAFFADSRFAEAGSLPALYAAAWSSTDSDAVAGLYAETAVRVDAMTGIRVTGREAIAGEARTFFERHPGARWTLTTAFGDVGVFKDPAPRGGLYGVTAEGPDGRPCTVEVAVVFDTGPGEIIDESIYYEAESVLSCGWFE